MMIKHGKLIVSTVGAGFLLLASSGGPRAVAPSSTEEWCRYTGSRGDGQNKICYYKCPSGDAAITVGRYEGCPLTIQR